MVCCAQVAVGLEMVSTRAHHIPYHARLLRDVVAEHAAITDAVLKRDVALACDLLGRHIGDTEIAMRRFFESSPSDSR